MSRDPNGPLYALGGAHPHALEKHDAMRGLATGNRKGKAVERAQDIHTPDSILDVCRDVFGGTIALDPCSSIHRVPFAARNAFGVTELTNTVGDLDGLTMAWERGTYANPPFKHLRAWLAKSASESALHIVLAPVRPHRTWWMAYQAADVVTAYLRPLKFSGFAGTFPAPLALHLRNADPAEAAAFTAAVERRALQTGFRPGLTHT